MTEAIGVYKKTPDRFGMPILDKIQSEPADPLMKLVESDSNKENRVVL